MDFHACPAMTDAPALARRALAAMDLTRLECNDTAVQIGAFCRRALTPFGPPAAICVYPEHVATARTELDQLGLSTLPIAAVVNFPDGSTELSRVRSEIGSALAEGAVEFDVVMPWRALLAGDEAAARALLDAARGAAGSARIKTILETGELADADLIRRASLIAIDCGADFIKTSTGKVRVNATPDAARIMLTAIRDCGGRCGFKAAGGIRSVAEAAVYFALADELLGPDWATPAHFRLGASALRDDVLGVLSGTAVTGLASY